MKIDGTYNNIKLTENGDLAFNKASENEMINILFQSEYYRNHLDELPSIGNTPKAKLFARFMRDPRFGLGLRELGKKLMLETGCSVEEVVKSGRVDDLFMFENTDSWKEVLAYLYTECKKGNALVRKWMPRYNSRNKALATKLASTFFANLPVVARKCAYGKLVRVETTESDLSARTTDNINFEHVPSKASLKYARRFAKGDDTKERYAKFIEEVKNGKKSIKTSVTTPYDLYLNRNKVDADAFFAQLKKVYGSWFPIVDTSGSMAMKDANDAYGKALAIGHYLSKTSTYLPNQLMAFSAIPHMMTLGADNGRTRWMGLNCPEFQALQTGDSQYIKEIRSMYTGDCSNTNLISVMKILMETSELPEYTVILTDMEFDRGSHVSIRQFENHLKQLGKSTKLVWWNFNSYNTTAPETDEYGNIFLSGYNPSLLQFLEAGFNMEQFFNKLLSAYEEAISK